LVTTLRAQSLSLEVASTNLNIHVSSVASTFDSFLPVATRELDRQSALLKTHALDLEIISKVKVHPDFLSASIRKSVESGGKERTLGDYVSGTKMRVVAESCAKLHGERLVIITVQAGLICDVAFRGPPFEV
jgi:autophagy-related protein 11